MTRFLWKRREQRPPKVDPELETRVLKKLHNDAETMIAELGHEQALREALILDTSWRSVAYVCDDLGMDRKKALLSLGDTFGEIYEIPPEQAIYAIRLASFFLENGYGDRPEEDPVMPGQYL